MDITEIEIERIALAACEDYSKEGSLSEIDVSSWAQDFARRYKAGEIA
jgi:hypothetical protein